MVEGNKILDVGCTAGKFSKRLANSGFEVHAIDVLEKSIEVAKVFSNSKKLNMS